MNGLLFSSSPSLTSSNSVMPVDPVRSISLQTLRYFHPLLIPNCSTFSSCCKLPSRLSPVKSIVERNWKNWLIKVAQRRHKRSTDRLPRTPAVTKATYKPKFYVSLVCSLVFAGWLWRMRERTWTWTSLRRSKLVLKADTVVVLTLLEARALSIPLVVSSMHIKAHVVLLLPKYATSHSSVSRWQIGFGCLMVIEVALSLPAATAA